MLQLLLLLLLFLLLFLCFFFFTFLASQSADDRITAGKDTCCEAAAVQPNPLNVLFSFFFGVNLGAAASCCCCCCWLISLLGLSFICSATEFEDSPTRTGILLERKINKEQIFDLALRSFFFFFFWKEFLLIIYYLSLDLLGG